VISEVLFKGGQKSELFLRETDTRDIWIVNSNLSQGMASSYEKPDKSLDITGAYWQPVIRLRSRCARSALDDVQAVHEPLSRKLGWSIGIAAGGEVADVTRVAGESGGEEVGVERDDDVGFRKIVARLDGLSEGHLRAFEDVAAIDRLVDVPLGLRIDFEETVHLIGKRGRRGRRREDADARALQ